MYAFVYKKRFIIFLFQRWIDLNLVLEAVIPYSKYISDESYYQYVERLVYRFHARKSMLKDVPIIDSLKQVIT